MQDPYAQTSWRDWQLLPYWLYLTATLSALDFFRAYRSSSSKPLLSSIYPRAPWQETSHLAARQLGTAHALLALMRVHGGLCVHDANAYNACHASFAVVLLHFAWERFAAGTIGARNLSATEAVALVSLWWMFNSKMWYAEAGYQIEMERQAAGPVQHSGHEALQHGLPYIGP